MTKRVVECDLSMYILLIHLSFLVWWKYVTPLISMKNYSSFAIEYLKDILSLKGNSKAISPEELNKLFNYLYTRQAQIISKTDLKELATSLKVS